MRHFLVIFAVLEASILFAAEPRVHRDLAYAEPKYERHMLDVYQPSEGKLHPIVFWIHGGGWQRGSKNDMHSKPPAFLEQGYVFVATNYRFVPNVTIKEMAGDVAKAIRWTHEHAKQYGGDPDRIIVMGHSAGAQLAALVCTDDRYLKAEGLSLSIIKGCVPVDGDTYDVPKQIATVEEKRANIYKWKFGDERSQRDLSPITYVAKGKGIPPVLIVHVAEHPETKGQSERLVQALVDAGISARTFPAAETDHVKLNTDLGLPDDKPTKAILGFVQEVLGGHPATLEGFKEKLSKAITPDTAVRSFGKPDRQIGSGLIIYEYNLSDGTKVWLGFPGLAPIQYAKHVKQDGTKVDLPLR